VTRFNSIERIWGYVKVRILLADFTINVAQIQKEGDKVGSKVSSADLPLKKSIMHFDRRDYTDRECKALVEQVIRRSIPNKLAVKTLGFNQEYIDKYLALGH
jgi:hypothetical protein